MNQQQQQDLRLLLVVVELHAKRKRHSKQSHEPSSSLSFETTQRLHRDQVLLTCG
jgi:hypothetical protein